VVKRFLGEGGKKRVYLAHDELLDRDVAFALIKVEGLDEVGRRRILRQAQTMGRLGEHPNIVPLHDLGNQDSQPFLVMPVMAGGDVNTLLRQGDQRQLSLEQAVAIAKDVSRGLDFAHGSGVVHRDLKPGNVWIASDGAARIGDFGLAVTIDRSQLTSEGMMLGTAAYIPPEQAMGQPADDRSDLYSLGAMIYEMVCGRPPFLGDDSVAIIGQHINTPPVAPTWRRSDCPRPLEALIMRLLAKDPSERPKSAADVLAALESIDLSMSDEPAQGVKDKANVLDSLAGDVFVGRQAEMGQLKAALEDALGGKGRMVTLVGEPGIGKTRTAQELATYARLRGCQVLWGRCYEEQGVPPYWPWVQSIRLYVRDCEPERLNSELGAGAADVAEIVSEVRSRLPDLPMAVQLEKPEQARFRLFDSIVAFLKAASQNRPLALVLDDLHWSDVPSLMLLQFLAREISGSRLLLIGTYRDVDLNRQHPLAETLAELTRERRFERVVLRGLSFDDVGRFIEVASGMESPRSLAQAVYSQTEGNPLFGTEVVRLLVQEGELTAQNVRERDSWEIRVPEGVREVLGRGLNRLSGKCNETLTIASVIGREFTLEQLDGLIDDLNQDMLLDVLEEGLTARVIEETPTAVGLYQFTHALIQETLTQEISLTRRVRLHARIAVTLEELYASDPESHAAELAHHFAQAETIHGTDKLVRYSGMAGYKALANYAYEEAANRFRTALSALDDTPMNGDKADLMFGMGRSQLALFDVQSGWQFLKPAFDYYADVGDNDKAIQVAQYPFAPVTGVFPPDLEDVLTRALDIVTKGSIDSVRILSTYGRLLSNVNGDYEKAREVFGKAIDISRREQDHDLEIISLAAAAAGDSYDNNWQRCVEWCLEVLELRDKSNDLFALTSATAFLIRGLIATGHPEQASQHALEFLSLAERFRDHGVLSTAYWLNGVIARMKGDWDEARRFTDIAFDWSPGDGRVLGTRIVMEFDLGENADGESFLNESVSDDNIGPYYVHPPVFASQGIDVGIEASTAFYEELLAQPHPPPMSVCVATTALGLTAVAEGDIGAIRRHRQTMSSFDGGFVWFAFVCVDRISGILASALGEFELANGHFSDAEAFYRKAGYSPELAWSLSCHADMLLTRDGDADRDRATTLLDESLQISSDLGMRPLMERVLSRREILKA
jgi:tetratricopeptide (TPR) repeat protein